MKRKDASQNRLRVEEIMMMKYKKSSLFFWYKPNQKIKIPKFTPNSASKSGGFIPTEEILSSIYYYPRHTLDYKKHHGQEISADVNEIFKISITGINNFF